MIKVFFISAVRPVLCALLANIVLWAAEPATNTLSHSTTLLHLKHWYILKDAHPESPLPALPDHAWRVLDSNNAEKLYAEGNWILRTKVFIADSVSEKIIWGVFPMQFLTAYELYWDDVRIGQNGIRGMGRDDERPGEFGYYLALPQQLTKSGHHTLTLRLSHFHNDSPWKWYYGDVIVGQYEAVVKKLFTTGYQAFFISGILFVALLFHLFLYITRQRKTEHLLFSLVCLFIVLDFAVTQAVNFFSFPTTYIHFEYYFYQVNTLLFTILFPVFLLYAFGLPKKIIAAILVVTLTAYVFFAHIWNLFDVLSLCVLCLSTAVTTWAVWLRREESIVISAGLLLSWAAYYLNFAFEGLSATMVLCTSFSVARQFAVKEKAEKEAQLKSARLEIELLKKHINPHFILNTLTSIIVWLRKDPAAAIQLIEALAEEFRMIHQVSALRQIPLCQEIDICKAHLKIMSYRKGADYRMETAGIDEQGTVPPLIFHTLVENGLTHGYEKKSVGIFTLRKEKQPDGARYILANDGEFNTADAKGSTGFGMRYIQNRLEESYPARWKITSGKKPDGWETVIEIRDK